LQVAPFNAYSSVRSYVREPKPNSAAASMVWSYIGEITFNMLILVGSVKMSDHVVREMMGL